MFAETISSQRRRNSGSSAIAFSIATKNGSAGSINTISGCVFFAFDAESRAL
jgi:hypothetical protein